MKVSFHCFIYIISLLDMEGLMKLLPAVLEERLRFLCYIADLFRIPNAVSFVSVAPLKGGGGGGGRGLMLFFIQNILLSLAQHNIQRA
jgi:hypothetical protein